MFCIPLKCMINYIGIEINGLKSDLNPGKKTKESGGKNRFRGLCLLGVPFSIRPLETNGNNGRKSFFKFLFSLVFFFFSSEKRRKTAIVNT